MTVYCELCGGEFKNKNSLYNHRSVSKGKCNEKKERKKKEIEDSTFIASLDKSHIIRAVQQQEQHEKLKAKLEEKNKMIEEKEEIIKQMKRTTEEHVRMLKKFIPNGYKPTIPGTLREKVAGGQSWKCAICIKEFNGADFDIDHKDRWIDSFDNTESNLQALCIPCHRLKTSNENSTNAT